jgi:hypothetical protein
VKPAGAPDRQTSRGQESVPPWRAFGKSVRRAEFTQALPPATSRGGRGPAFILVSALLGDSSRAPQFHFREHSSWLPAHRRLPCHTPAVKRWQRFESLVASIHAILNSADHQVETDVQISEPSGSTHQIDVLLRPKTPFAGPIIISCKAWAAPVGVEHVREWADIVQHTGAASGVIVAQSGFTAGAIAAAQNLERRVSLWLPKPLSASDLTPGKNSAGLGFSRVLVRGAVKQPRFVDGSFRLDVRRADGRFEGRQLQFVFSAATRMLWYLRDDHDNLIGNLWDLYAERAQAAKESSTISITPDKPSFLVLDGVRLRLNSASFEVAVHEQDFSVDIDLERDAIGYQNVVTGVVTIVPIPSIHLSAVQSASNQDE